MTTRVDTPQIAVPGRVRPRRHHAAGRHLPPHVGRGAARPRDRRSPPAHRDGAVARSARSVRPATRPRPRSLPARRRGVRPHSRTGRPGRVDSRRRRSRVDVAHARLGVDVAVARTPARRRPDRPVPRRHGRNLRSHRDGGGECGTTGDDPLRHRALLARGAPRLLGRGHEAVRLRVQPERPGGRHGAGREGRRGRRPRRSGRS